MLLASGPAVGVVVKKYSSGTVKVELVLLSRNSATENSSGLTDAK